MCNSADVVIGTRVQAVVVHQLRMQELALRIKHAVFMPNKNYIESFCQRGFTTMNSLYATSTEKFTAQTSSKYGTTTDNPKTSNLLNIQQLISSLMLAKTLTHRSHVISWFHRS